MRLLEDPLLGMGTSRSALLPSSLYLALPLHFVQPAFPNGSLSSTCCGTSHYLDLHVLVPLPGIPSPRLCVWVTSPQEWESRQRMGFEGPEGQGRVCLGGHGNKQSLSRPDSRSAELRVFGGQSETKCEESGVGGWDRPCRQSGLRRSWQAQGPAC